MRAGYQTALVGKLPQQLAPDETPPYFDRWALSEEPHTSTPTFNVNGTHRVRRAAIRTRAANGRSSRSASPSSVSEKDDSAPWLLYVAPHAPHHPLRSPTRATRTLRCRAGPGTQRCFEQDRSDKPPSFSNINFSLAQGRESDGGSAANAACRSTTWLAASSRGCIAWRELEEHPGLLSLGQRLSVGRPPRSAGTATEQPVRSASRTRRRCGCRLYARWPRHLPEGTRDPRLTGTVDIAPTVLEAAACLSRSDQASARRALPPRAGHPRPNPARVLAGARSSTGSRRGRPYARGSTSTPSTTRTTRPRRRSASTTTS